MDIDPEILKSTYTENYFKGEEYVDYLRDKNILQTNFRKRLQKIFRLVPSSQITKAVEIGCAYGFFAEELQKALPATSYSGYDVVPEAVSYGREQLRQNVFCGDFMEASLDKDHTDVFMWDVIEHLPDPDRFIAKAAECLVPGGRIHITTGDIGRLLPRLQKEKWRMIHPPSHLHYFSLETLTKLLEAKGFRVISVSYPPVYRSIRLIWYSLFMLRKKYPAFIGRLYELIPERMNIAMNTFDIMFVIAEKHK
jgi:SAM-dependent methyltransferase